MPMISKRVILGPHSIKISFRKKKKKKRKRKKNNNHNIRWATNRKSSIKMTNIYQMKSVNSARQTCLVCITSTTRVICFQALRSVQILSVMSSTRKGCIYLRVCTAVTSNITPYEDIKYIPFLKISISVYGFYLIFLL